MKTNRFFVAAIYIALALTFSACNSGGGGSNNASYTCKLSNGNCIETTSVSDCSQAGGSVVDVCQGQNGNTPSSSNSNVTLSSSSKLSSSSSSTTSGNQQGIIYGTSVSYGGETYQSVVIGTQTWMARNLNYNASGSICYDNNQSNCAKYGRLYNWATARTVCPAGWHLPSDAEWTTLTNFVGSNAVRKLKATNGWYDNYNGTDDYGFAALPGGRGDSDGYFISAGYYGYWWSSSERNSYDAWHIYMRYSSVGVNRDYSDKGYLLFSVRCLQD